MGFFKSTPAAIGTMTGPLLGRLARQDGGNEAIRGRDVSLTFAQLTLAVNRVAGGLLKAGLVTGNAVGVALADPVERMVACIAVLSIGCAYFMPDVRRTIAPIVCGARVALLLHEEGFVEVLAPLRQGRREATAVGDDTPALYLAEAGPSTAGEQWRVLTHGDLAACAGDLASALHVGPRDRLERLADARGDSGDLEWMLPLVLGARVKLLSDEQLRAPREGEAATLLQLPVEALAAALAPTAPRCDLSGVRILLGGEAPAPDLVNEIERARGQLWCFDVRRAPGPCLARLT